MNVANYSKNRNKAKEGFTSGSNLFVIEVSYVRTILVTKLLSNENIHSLKFDSYCL